MLSFEYNGRQYDQWHEEDALATGVPAGVIAEAKSKLRRKLVSAECRRRIYSVASAEAQMNIATAAGVIAGKSDVDRTEEDQAVLDGGRFALMWVGDMRAAFEALAAEPEKDFLDDAAWPPLPPAILDLISRF